MQHWFTSVIKPVVYKLQSKIKLVDSTQSPEEVVREIQSKALIQKVINALPFQATCYQKGLFQKKELYGNTLPVKFEFEKNNAVKFTEDVVLNFIDKNSFEIVQNDTLTHVFFNKPVRFPFAGFKATAGPSFNPGTSQLLVRFNAGADLLEYYAHNLHVTTNPDKSIGLSLIATNPRKGADFLNELIKIVNSPVIIPAEQINPAGAVRNVKLQKLNKELIILNHQADKLKSEQATVVSRDTTPAVKNVLPAKDNIQLTILTAIKPYAESPVAQFALIPYEYEVNDDVLKKAIIAFNGVQLEKQHALQRPEIPAPDVTALNNKLISLKKEILSRINAGENEASPGFRTQAFTNVSADNNAFKDSLSRIKKLIRLKQQQYYTLFQSSSVKIKPAEKRTRFIVTEWPDQSALPHSQVLTVLFLALAAGISLPISIISINYLFSSATAIKNDKRISIEMKRL